MSKHKLTFKFYCFIVERYIKKNNILLIGKNGDHYYIPLPIDKKFSVLLAYTHVSHRYFMSVLNS